MKHKSELFQIILGAFILIFGIHFLVQQEKLTMGGTESFLNFLDSILKNVCHLDINKFFGHPFTVDLVYIVTLFLGLHFLGKKFFKKSLLVTFLIITFTTLLSSFEIFKFKIFDSVFPFLEDKGHFRTALVYLLASLILGTGTGLIFKNKASMSGTGVVQNILKDKLKMPFWLILFLTDGLVIFLSFLIELSTHQSLMISVVIKYAFSFASLFVSIYTINKIAFSNKKNKKKRKKLSNQKKTTK
ncbi:YitT family protein [Candidatus Phytoplasma pruni]|uniref:YitT family protein n=1 Tax=Candidatus Phytoplasma pruni TaxID=479893 RepID=A0A851HBZ9_9MOLU|nr:YitT family protein [Candidatus Phytoplasma pruni]NWN45551.1 YitT family protein [Candidatus Phytoplasma pruni]